MGKFSLDDHKLNSLSIPIACPSNHENVFSTVIGLFPILFSRLATQIMTFVLKIKKTATVIEKNCGEPMLFLINTEWPCIMVLLA